MTEENTEQTVEKEVVSDALKAEAKSIGIKSVHLYKTNEKLQKKIDEVNAESAVQKVVEQKAKEVTEVETEVEVDAEDDGERIIAPPFRVSSQRSDDRVALIEKLEREHPGCKFVFQSSSVTDSELKAKCLGRTKFTLKNDIVCVAEKTGYDALVETRNSDNYAEMKTLESGSHEVGCYESKAKKSK